MSFWGFSALITWQTLHQNSGPVPAPTVHLKSTMSSCCCCNQLPMALLPLRMLLALTGTHASHKANDSHEPLLIRYMGDCLDWHRRWLQCGRQPYWRIAHGLSPNFGRAAMPWCTGIALWARQQNWAGATGILACGAVFYRFQSTMAWEVVEEDYLGGTVAGVVVTRFAWAWRLGVATATLKPVGGCCSSSLWIVGFVLSRPNVSTGEINCFYRYIILY